MRRESYGLTVRSLLLLILSIRVITVFEMKVQLFVDCIEQVLPGLVPIELCKVKAVTIRDCSAAVVVT